MSIHQRRERDKQTLRRRILDAAREMFAAEGYEAVSMRKIADKIEYSPTTIYLHFKDKTDLFNAICEETFAQLVKRLKTIERRCGDDALAYLHEGMRAYVDFGLKHPNHYVVTFILSPKSSGDYSYRGSVGEQAFMYMRRAVERCVAAKVFRDVEIDATAQALWASVHGVTSLLIAHEDFPFVPKTKLVETLINGLTRGFHK